MNAPNPLITLSADYRIDGVCRRFGSAWKAGQRPRVEDYLEGVEVAERRKLL